MGGWVGGGGDLWSHCPLPPVQALPMPSTPYRGPLYPMLSLTHRSKLAQWAKGGGLHLGGAS